jgi:hypothetical protein
MEKKTYDLFKALKSFIVYVIHSKVIAYVPSLSVKEILIHPDIDRIRNNWIAKIIEFDLDINPTKLVKGQGLARLLAESNCKDLGVHFINSCSENQQAKLSDEGYQVSPPFPGCTWYHG